VADGCDSSQPAATRASAKIAHPMTETEVAGARVVVVVVECRTSLRVFRPFPHAATAPGARGPFWEHLKGLRAVALMIVAVT